MVHPRTEHHAALSCRQWDRCVVTVAGALVRHALAPPPAVCRRKNSARRGGVTGAGRRVPPALYSSRWNWHHSPGLRSTCEGALVRCRGSHLVRLGSCLWRGALRRGDATFQRQTARVGGLPHPSRTPRRGDRSATARRSAPVARVQFWAPLQLIPRRLVGRDIPLFCQQRRLRRARVPPQQSGPAARCIAFSG